VSDRNDRWVAAALLFISGAMAMAGFILWGVIGMINFLQKVKLLSTDSEGFLSWSTTDDSVDRW